jgi:hypothetical protein
MVANDQPAQLQALTSFTVTVGYHHDKTTLDVRRPDLAQPVARMVKAGPIRARAAYELLTGPGLDQHAGQLSPSGALCPDGTPVGIVNLSGGRVADADIHPMSGARHSYVVADPTVWRVVQAGLPPLVGHATDRRTRLNYNRLTRIWDRVGFEIVVDTVLASLMAMSFDFRAPDSAGFRVKLAGGWRARFEVAVADSRVDRRMVLACVSAMAARITWTPRREVTG